MTWLSTVDRNGLFIFAIASIVLSLSGHLLLPFTKRLRNQQLIMQCTIIMPNRGSWCGGSVTPLICGASCGGRCGGRCFLKSSGNVLNVQCPLFLNRFSRPPIDGHLRYRWHLPRLNASSVLPPSAAFRMRCPACVPAARWVSRCAVCCEDAFRAQLQTHATQKTLGESIQCRCRARLPLTFGGQI